MKRLALVLMLASIQPTLASESAAVSPAKAAELALHRVGKLTELNPPKLDQSFVSRFASVRIQTMENSQPGDPAFQAIVSQDPPQNGSAVSAEILLDSSGRALSNRAIPGTPGSAPAWPNQDSLSLAEAAFHHLLDHGAHYPQLAPFGVNFVEMNLVQVGAGSNMLAKAIFKASSTTDRLEITVNLSGVVVDTKVVK